MSDWKFSAENGIGILELDCAGTEVNTLGEVNLNELSSELDQIAGRTDLKALLITSAKKRIFIAGADIKQIDQIKARDQAIHAAEQGKAVFQKIENLKIPAISVISGVCLGGGLELSLACRYRIASFSPDIKIGLPEVNLGILPGFGGSIRLPRLLGLMKALPLILAGRMVSSEEALKLGIVDKLFPESSLRQDALRFAADVIGGSFKRRPAKRSFIQGFFENTPFGRDFVFQRARTDVLQKTKGFYPAPLKIIRLIRKTYGKRGAKPYRLESEYFADLGVTDLSKKLIQLFFLSEKYKKLAWTSFSGPVEDVSKCGIIGAGVMGGGIAQLVSSRGIPVRVKDISDKALGGALKEAAHLYKDAVKRRRMKKSEADHKMGLISVGLGTEGLSRCGIIIEAVVEDLGIKKKVFQELDALMPPQTVLASNTSSLSVTQMAEGCKHPERIVGLHFFNPVHRMPLVEVIRAEKTSDEAMERIIRFARKLGKTVIVTADRPGFLVNRLLLPYMNEAAHLLEEGMPPTVIDRIAESFGMPMGPIELTDVVGIDVAYKVAHILEDAFGERMKVASILHEVKSQGLLGKKSGKGFYLHQGKSRKINPGVKLPGKSSGVLNADALKRMIYVMINEAARCLEEHVIDSPATVDLGMIFGTGFPPFRGGLLRYADSLGLENVVRDLERFQKITGRAIFEPSPKLRQLASQKGCFYSS